MTNNLDMSSFGNHSYSISLDLKQTTPHVLLLLDMALLGSLVMGALEIIDEQNLWYEEPFFMAAMGALALLGLGGCVKGITQVHFDDDETRLRNGIDAFKTIAYSVFSFYAAIICLPIAYMMEVGSFVRRGCRLSEDQISQRALIRASQSSEPSQSGFFCCPRKPIAELPAPNPQV